MRPSTLLAVALLVSPTCLVAQINPPEVILNGQAWQYSRVYPLLDGLFQDVASTQLKNLTLDPNASNGTSLDALQQSIQFQVQYGQLAGIQNAAAAQTMATNTGYQTQLVQQQATLLQGQLLAQRQLGEAQTKADSLPANADSNTVASAKQAATVAQDNLTSITAQMALVKGQLAAPAYSPSSSTTALVPSQLPTPATIPSSLSSSATGPGSAPSFPATKQMDNQMQLLWERVSRLVGTMARPDSLEAGATLYLVAFDTGIFPEKHKRKHQLLDTTYTLKCGSGTGDPTVLDMFPRAAAVNITNIKYRDTSFGIGALLSFFGIGISGSYNREHLKLSQLLGQSSYITGHGVGQSEFGWLFGIAIGDDQISSDTRKTFALVEAPTTCRDPAVALKSASWSKSPAPTGVTLRLALPQPSDNAITVKSLSYNRIEYDPATVSAANPAGVTLRIVLDHDMDQQETLSANGIPIKRARDTFGRAIGSGGSGGLLESTGLGVNTWIPLGPHSLIVTLDASMFADRFPLILLSSPARTVDLTSGPIANVIVSGRNLNCSASPCVLPSLGYVKSSPKHFAVARWMGQTRDKDKICITVADPTPQSPVGGAAPATIPATQVLSRADNQIWGSNVTVSMIKQGGEVAQLRCDPLQDGSRFICDAPGYDSSTDAYPRVQLEILDTTHAGGPIKGMVDLPACTNSINAQDLCRKPLIWDVKNPVFDSSDAAKRKWLFDVVLVNVDANRNVIFEEGEGNLKGTISCTGDDTRCTARIPISTSAFSAIKDSMKLQVEGADGKYYPITIVNLYTNIRPVVTQIDQGKTLWYGQNFVFNKLQIGDSKKVYSVGCSQGVSSCHVTDKYDPKARGYMYFVYDGQLVELVQLNGSGGLTPLFLDLPTPQPASGKAVAAAAIAHTPNHLPDAVVPPAVELNKTLSMQAIQH